MKENGTDFIESKLKSTPIGTILFYFSTGFCVVIILVEWLYFSFNTKFTVF